MLPAKSRLHLKEKQCLMQVAYNMSFGDKKINQLQYNVCMSRDVISTTSNNRAKYTTIPSD